MGADLIPGEHISGWMNYDELIWLGRTAAEMESVLEIGCWQGKSTFALLTACPGPVYAVDHFQGSPEHQGEMAGGFRPYPEFLKNCGHFPNLRLFPVSSQQAALNPNIPPLVDMVFIDGAHEYEAIAEDLHLWGSRARKIVSGHDYGYTSINRALEEKFGRQRIEQGNGTIWFVKVEAA